MILVPIRWAAVVHSGEGGTVTLVSIRWALATKNGLNGDKIVYCMSSC